MKYGLREIDIEAIQGIFTKYPQVQKVMLYGSRAKGTYRNGSDIDSALFGESLDLSLLFKIETELDDLFLPYKMDVSMIHQIKNQNLIDHIKRLGLVLYQKDFR